MQLRKKFDRIIKHEQGRTVEYFVMNKEDYLTLAKQFTALCAKVQYYKRCNKKRLLRIDKLLNILEKKLSQ